MNKLELCSSRAVCIYQQVTRMADEFSTLEGRDLVEKRRVRAVALVNKLKDLFTTYWQHLDDRQKDYVSVEALLEKFCTGGFLDLDSFKNGPVLFTVMRVAAIWVGAYKV